MTHAMLKCSFTERLANGTITHTAEMFHQGTKDFFKSHVAVQFPLSSKYGMLSVYFCMVKESA